jgi:hypothetical protein
LVKPTSSWREALTADGHAIVVLLVVEVLPTDAGAVAEAGYHAVGEEVAVLPDLGETMVKLLARGRRESLLLLLLLHREMPRIVDREGVGVGGRDMLTLGTWAA